MENYYCSRCTTEGTKQFCYCSSVPLFLCDQCVSKHFADSRSTCHQVLPIETLPYVKVPGYIDEYRARSSQRETALSELQGNLLLIDQWQAELRIIEDRVTAVVQQHCRSQIQQLALFRTALEAAITAGVREADISFFDPSPPLRTEIARHIRHYREGALRLVSCHTDLAAQLRQFEELAQSLVLLLQVEPGCLQLPIPNIRDNVAVVEKPLGQMGNEAYIGEVNERQEKHGYGKAVLETKEIVESHWQHGEIAGRRKITMSDGSFYIGSELTSIHAKQPIPPQSHSSKKAVLALLAVLIAVGVLKSDSNCDVRTLESVASDVGVYEGQRNAALEMHGTGTLRYWSGMYETYTGEWKNGVKSGIGTMKYAEGSTYEGQWANDLRHGFGQFTTASRSSYEGTWKNDQKHGFGIEVLQIAQPSESSTKTTYFGGFCEDEKSGFGVLFTGDEMAYIGYWQGKKDCSDSRFPIAGEPQYCFSITETYARLAARYRETTQILIGHEDEISLSVSQAVYLTAIDVTTTFDRHLEIPIFEVFRDTTALENRVYSDYSNYDLNSVYPEKTIKLQRIVRLEANTKYILRATVNGVSTQLAVSAKQWQEERVMLEVIEGGNQTVFCGVHFRTECR